MDVSPFGLNRTPRRDLQGYTLIECALVCGAIGVAATLALGQYQQQLSRAARLDAQETLVRIQFQQESHRAAHGMYAQDLAVLQGVTSRSRQGHYRIELHPIEAESYTAVATAIGTLAQDSACAQLTLMVKQGFSKTGPSARCWNR